MPEYKDVSESTSTLVTAIRATGRAGIVLHSTEGVNSLAWLQGGSAKHGTPASSDYLIARNGDIYQLTKPLWYSYHVGIGNWREVNNTQGKLNQLLVGIEIESRSGDTPRYTDFQLIASAALVRVLLDRHRLGFTSLVRHADIARPPGRRSDPVAFPDWIWSRELMRGSLRPEVYQFPAAMP